MFMFRFSSGHIKYTDVINILINMFFQYKNENKRENFQKDVGCTSNFFAH